MHCGVSGGSGIAKGKLDRNERTSELDEYNTTSEAASSISEPLAVSTVRSDMVLAWSGGVSIDCVHRARDTSSHFLPIEVIRTLELQLTLNGCPLAVCA